MNVNIKLIRNDQRWQEMKQGAQGYIGIYDIYIFIPVDDKGLQVKGCHAQETEDIFFVETQEQCKGQSVEMNRKEMQLEYQEELSDRRRC